MNNRVRVLFLIFLVFIVCANDAFSETVLLISGKTVEGDIVEATEEYVKLDFYGVVLTYALKDIETIDGFAPAAFFVKDQAQKITTNAPSAQTSPRERILIYLQKRYAFLTTITKELQSISAQYSQASMRSDPKQIEQVLVKIGDICDAHKSTLRVLNVPPECTSLNILTLAYVELQRQVNIQYAQGDLSNESVKKEFSQKVTEMAEEQVRLMRKHTIKKSDIFSKATK